MEFFVKPAVNDLSFGYKFGNFRDLSRYVYATNFLKNMLKSEQPQREVQNMQDVLRKEDANTRRSGGPLDINALFKVKHVNGDVEELPALTIAAMAGGVLPEKIHALLEWGADPHYRNDLALQYALMLHGENKEVIRAILNFGVDDTGVANMEVRDVAQRLLNGETNLSVSTDDLDPTLARVKSYVDEQRNALRRERRADVQSLPANVLFGSAWTQRNIGIPSARGRHQGEGDAASVFDFFNLEDVRRRSAQADAEAEAEHRQMISEDASRYGSVEAQNQHCYSLVTLNGRRYFKDVILSAYQPLDANRIVRLVSVDHQNKEEPSYHCFDAVVLHDYLKLQKEKGIIMKNPRDNSLIFTEDFEKIAAKAASLNYEYPEDLTDAEEEALAEAALGR